MPDMYQYKIILSWSDEDGAYIAEVPALPGCAADGHTYQEALTNVEQVIQEWIDVAENRGSTIPNIDGSSCGRKPGSAAGKLRIIEDDEEHLRDFRDYIS
jgi:predicted RNase H-like HicB family nuclease